MAAIDREQVKQQTQDDNRATLIEVLDEEHFNHFHLPGANNVPLKDGFDDAIQQVVPNKSENVIVYCQSRECDASPRAAQRMEKLGYEHVFDYAAGKMDWKQAGLPIEVDGSDE